MKDRSSGRLLRLAISSGCSLLALLVARQASAGRVPASGGYCNLSRPLSLPHVSAMPPDLQCFYDEDGNGLDDDVEAELARCVAPALAFGAGEPNRLPSEPFTVFNMHRMAGESTGPTDAYRVRINYSFVFQSDGGFVQSDFCKDDHHGDTEEAHLEVVVERGLKGWYAHVVAVDANGADLQRIDFGFPPLVSGFTTPVVNPTHPTLYPSPGKHHMYHQPGAYTFGPLGCDDYSYGEGNIVVPGSLIFHRGDGSLVPHRDLHHVPVFLDDVARDPHGTAPLGPSGRWWNACLVGLHPRAFPPIDGDPALAFWRPATRSLIPNLWPAPYGGEAIENECFAGGLTPDVPCADVTPIYRELVASRADLDADHDGRTDFGGEITNITRLSLQQNDHCPLSVLEGSDLDGDGLFDPCDPDPTFKQIYVAAGGCGFAGVATDGCLGGAKFFHFASDTLFDPVGLVKEEFAPSYGGLAGAWLRYQPNTTPVRLPDLGTGSTRGGFLDDERDGLVNGEDLCPLTATKGPIDVFSRNKWAEDANWSAGPGTPGGTLAGVFHRGDLCDPHPTILPEWKPVPVLEGSACGTPPPGESWEVIGADILHAENQAFVGVSVNDPARLTTSPTLLDRVLDTQTLRCACRQTGTGSALDYADCLDLTESDCARSGPQLTRDRTTRAGRGWHVVDEQFCRRDDQGYCIGGATLITPLRSNTSDAPWDWIHEFDDDADASITLRAIFRHFGAGEFTSEPLDPLGRKSLTAKFGYAVWTQTDIDRAPFASSPFPRSTGLPEPEDVDPSLADVTLTPSRRLRAGFGSELSVPTSMHCKAIPIITPRLVDPLTLKNFRDIFGAFDPAGTPFPWTNDPWAIGVGGPRVSDTLVVRPMAETASAIALTGAASDWISSGEGFGALLVPSPRMVNGQQAFALAPDLLWIERSTANGARWARLQAIAVTPDLITYEQIASDFVGASFGQGSLLVQDARGGTAAIIDPAASRVLAFEPVLGRWLSSDIPAGAARSGATYVLSGSALYVVGGGTDAWTLDALGTGARSSPVQLPSRLNPRVTLASDRTALLLVGGLDANQRMHDDVWIVPFEANGALGTARLVKADTTAAAAFVPETTLVAGPGDGAFVRSWTISNLEPSKTTAAVRAEGGWQVSNVLGDPLSPRCKTTDTRAGDVCAEGPSWWSGVGRRACAVPNVGGACEGSQGLLLGLTTLGPARPRAQGVAIDGATAWVLRHDALERWHLGSFQALLPTEIKSLPVALPGKARVLASQGGQLLVGSDHMVAVARATADGFTLSSGTVICGEVRSIAPMGAGRWAVVTGLTLVIVDTSISGSPQVVSTSIISENELIVLPANAASLCIAAEKAFGKALGDPDDDKVALAAHGARILLARGRRVLDIDVHKAEAPRTSHTIVLAFALRALRIDDEGSRAYGVAYTDKKPNPIFDLRNDGLALGGVHDVALWVERQDSGAYTMRVDERGVVSVAVVAR